MPKFALAIFGLIFSSLGLGSGDTPIPTNFRGKAVLQFLKKDCVNRKAQNLLKQEWKIISPELITEILDKYFRPAEKAMSVDEYVQRVALRPERLELGIQFYKENQKDLNRLEKKYKVPGEILVAILGIESMYGKNQGHYKVLDSLSTLGFHEKMLTEKGKAAKYFQRELCTAAKAIDKSKAEPNEFLGSFAGAMGMPQFMPSSYNKLAADGDGDGKKDIWTNRLDALASIGLFLRRNNFQNKKPEKAVHIYNHSDAYVQGVLVLAKRIRAAY